VFAFYFYIQIRFNQSFLPFVLFKPHNRKLWQHWTKYLVMEQHPGNGENFRFDSLIYVEFIQVVFG